MIKGDAQVALKAVSSAVSTYLAARKETIDPHEKALAYWTSELFRRANAQTYTAKVAPVGGKRGTFNLIDPDQRKAAMGALLDECLVLIDPDLKTAQRSQKLADIFPMLQRIADLDQLDVVVNGNDDRTEGLSNALLDHARTLLSSALKTDWTRVNDIDQRANATINVPVSQWVNGVYVQQNIAQKTGLTEGNRTELNNIISVCGKIRDAANTFLPYASNDKDWTAVLNDALRVSGKAGDVLNADYGGSYGTPDTYGQNIPTNYPGEYPVQSQNIQLPQSQSSNGRKPAATQPAIPADATPTNPATPSTPAKTPARPAPVKPIPKFKSESVELKACKRWTGRSPGR